MSVENAVAALTDTIDGEIHLFAGYDRETFTPYHLGDSFVDTHSVDDLQYYFGVDFLENDLFTDSLFEHASRVEGDVRILDDRCIVTRYHDDGALMAIVGGDQSIDRIQTALSNIATGGDP